MITYIGSVKGIHLGGKVGSEDCRYMDRYPLPGVSRCMEGVQITIPDKMNGGNQGLQPQAKTKQTTTTVSTEQSMVQKAGRSYGRTFKMGRRVIHGNLVKTRLFNMVDDAVIRAVLIEVCGTQ